VCVVLLGLGPMEVQVVDQRFELRKRDSLKTLNKGVGEDTITLRQVGGGQLN